MNECSGCGLDFGSVSAFDAHRVGKFTYPWDLEHEDGRRCLGVDEIEAKGWSRDSRGRWRTPGVTFDVVARLKSVRSGVGNARRGDGEAGTASG